MSLASPAGASPIFWRQLFSLLKDRQVIPVVGQDAVVVEDELGACTLNEYLAGRAEQMLELKRTPPPRRPSLHEVACRYLEVAGDRQIGDIYWAVKAALAERPVPIPETLRKLARIRAFSLYVTTTFDDLLQRALDQERFAGQPRTQSYVYVPDRVQDLPGPVHRLHGPAVYHLLGRLSAVPDYVVTEEDTLEFVHSLQSENRRPNVLLDELRSHSLLLIGSGYSDWLMRFFLRIAKRERLLLARSQTIVVDARTTSDPGLAEFLRYFSAQTKVFAGDAVQFIDELAARWEEECGSEEDPVPEPAAVERAAEPEHAIFVSYASEDREAARRLADALREARLPVWFDQAGGLEGGEDYRVKILSRIRSASLFVPIMSRSVLTPEKRFFRLEWDEAVETSRRAAEGQAFIVPVRIDDVPQNSEGIKPRITELHWLDTARGTDFGTAVQRIRQLYREYQIAMRSAS